MTIVESVPTYGVHYYAVKVGASWLLHRAWEWNHKVDFARLYICKYTLVHTHTHTHTHTHAYAFMGINTHTHMLKHIKVGMQTYINSTHTYAFISLEMHTSEFRSACLAGMI